MLRGKMLSNFNYITLKHLIEKEGSEQKAVNVNLLMGVQVGKSDILVGKEDLSINSQYVSVTGGLGEDHAVDSRLQVKPGVIIVAIKEESEEK